MWRRIDLLLLDRLYQPTFDAVSEQVGDPIAMCRKLLVLVGVLTCCYVGWRFYHDVGEVPHVIIVAFVTSQTGLGLAAMFVRWLLRGIKYPVGSFNPLRYVIAVPRFLLLVIYTIILVVTSLLSDGWISVSLDGLRDLAIISALYFASCQNRPLLRQDHPQWVPVTP